MWNRVKQAASIGAAGEIVFGTAATGFRGVPVADLEALGPYSFTYVLTSAAGDYEVGYCVMQFGEDMLRQVLDASTPGGFAADTSGLTLVIAPAVTDAAAVSPTDGDYFEPPKVSGYRAVSLGSWAEADGAGTAVGAGAVAKEGQSSALGSDAVAVAASTAIGANAHGENDAIAIGDRAIAYNGRITIGNFGGPQVLYARLGSGYDTGVSETVTLAAGNDTLIGHSGNDFTFYGLVATNSPGVTKVSGIISVGADGFPISGTAMTKVFEVTAIVQQDTLSNLSYLVGPTITELYAGASTSGITLTVEGDSLRLTNGSATPVHYAGLLQGISASGWTNSRYGGGQEHSFYAPGGF